MTAPVIGQITSLDQLQRQLNTALAALSAAGSPGGSANQVQYNNAGAFGGFTVSGDGTLNVATGALTVTKSNGVAFGTAAFVNTGTSGATVPLLNAVNTFSNTNIFGNSSSPATVYMNGAAATIRAMYYLTGGVSRWLFGADNSAESAPQTGSNFIVSRYTNAGAFIDTPFLISRATGQVTFSTPPQVGTAPIPSVTFGTGAPGGTPANGALYFDTTLATYAGYVGNGGSWHAF